MSGAESQQTSDPAINNLSDNLANLNTEATPRTEEEYANAQLTLRAIVTSKEAGVIIGKAGKNVADLRDETGVRAGVSKVVPGVHDRVLTVTGALSGISKAYGIVSKSLLEGAPSMGMGGVVTGAGTHSKTRRTHTLGNLLSVEWQSRSLNLCKRTHWTDSLYRHEIAHLP